jgi:hypothetical protein
MTKKIIEQTQPPYWRPIGYYEATRALSKIDEYIDLLKLLTNFINPDDKKIIQDKYPEYQTLDHKNLSRIRQRVTQLSLPMIILFNRINLSPLYEYGGIEKEYNQDKNRWERIHKKTTKNLFIGIFDTPSITEPRQFEFLMEHLEVARGGYSYIKSLSKRRWKNPIWWLAQILRIPISIIEFAGINTQNEATSKMVYWIIQVLMGIVLALLIVRLGLPLKTIFNL